MSNIGHIELLYNVNIKELNSPYNLSRYILQLPYYKSSLSDDEKAEIHINSFDLEDVVMCHKLSKFIVEQQLTGAFLMNNCTKVDFDQMIKLIDCAENYSSDWIWNALQRALSNNNTRKTIKWIDSNWNSLQLILNHDNFLFQTQALTARDKEAFCEVDCQSFKRILTVLYFYQSLKHKIANNNIVLQQYMTAYDVYSDYNHIRKQHNKTVNDMRHRITSFIKCDVSKCKPFQKDKTIKFIQDINEKKAMDFGCELLDGIHCYFMHYTEIQQLLSKVHKQKGKQNARDHREKNKHKNARIVKKHVRDQAMNKQSFGCWMCM